MSTRHVVIVGGGVAGPALAYWLHRYGIGVTVVERSPDLRRAGQSVDLRGAGREVVRRMGLEERVRAAGTGERGIVFTDEGGRSRAAVGADVLAGTGGEGPTAELEILRGRLAEILYESTRDDVGWRFGEHVVAIEEAGDRARVRLSGGDVLDADVVVGADGIGSATRRSVFGDTDADGTPWVRPLGLSVAYLTVPAADGDTAWAIAQNSPGRRSLLLRPDDHPGTRRAVFAQITEPCLRGLDTREQEAVIRERFAGLGGLVPRALDALGTTDEFYAEDLAQVRMPSWSRGRTVLVGDAAYCPTGATGMGTSVALVGAYLLAHELGRGDGHAAAFARYEQTLRPYVTRAQTLAPGAPRVYNPRTRTGIRLMHLVLRTIVRRPLRPVLVRLASPPADTITLPDAPAVQPA